MAATSAADLPVRSATNVRAAGRSGDLAAGSFGSIGGPSMGFGPSLEFDIRLSIRFSSVRNRLRAASHSPAVRGRSRSARSGNCSSTIRCSKSMPLRKSISGRGRAVSDQYRFGESGCSIHSGMRSAKRFAMAMPTRSPIRNGPSANCRVKANPVSNDRAAPAKSPLGDLHPHVQDHHVRIVSHRRQVRQDHPNRIGLFERVIPLGRLPPGGEVELLEESPMDAVQKFLRLGNGTLSSGNSFHVCGVSVQYFRA